MLRSWVILQKVTIEGRSYKQVSERWTESVSEECDKMWHEPSWQQQDSPPPVVIMGLMSQGESGDSVPACYQACILTDRPGSVPREDGESSSRYKLIYHNSALSLFMSHFPTNFEEHKVKSSPWSSMILSYSPHLLVLFFTDNILFDEDLHHLTITTSSQLNTSGTQWIWGLN